MTNTVGTALNPLRPYEPDRERADLLEAGVDVPSAPGAPGVEPDGPPVALWHVRAVLNLILEVRAGHQAPARLHSLVHPRLVRLLSEETAVTTGSRYTLKSVHACRVAPHAVETCGTAQSQGRAYALVARFERTDQGWWCVRFDLIRPRRA